jgi:hypothetical protein
MSPYDLYSVGVTKTSQKKIVMVHDVAARKTSNL